MSIHFNTPKFPREYTQLCEWLTRTLSTETHRVLTKNEQKETEYSTFKILLKERIFSLIHTENNPEKKQILGTFYQTLSTQTPETEMIFKENFALFRANI